MPFGTVSPFAARPGPSRNAYVACALELSRRNTLGRSSGRTYQSNLKDSGSVSSVTFLTTEHGHICDGGCIVRFPRHDGPTFCTLYSALTALHSAMLWRHRSSPGAWGTGECRMASAEFGMQNSASPSPQTQTRDAAVHSAFRNPHSAIGGPPLPFLRLPPPPRPLHPPPPLRPHPPHPPVPLLRPTHRHQRDRPQSPIRNLKSRIKNRRASGAHLPAGDERFLEAFGNVARAINKVRDAIG